jgi:hypothetical protein
MEVKEEVKGKVEEEKKEEMLGIKEGREESKNMDVVGWQDITEFRFCHLCDKLIRLESKKCQNCHRFFCSKCFLDRAHKTGPVKHNPKWNCYVCMKKCDCIK